MLALFEFSSRSGSADVVEGDGAAAEENQSKGESGQGEREFVSTIAHEAVVKMDLGDGNSHVDQDAEGGDASEESYQNEPAAKEFGEGREISAPGWETEAGYKLNVMVKSAEDFVITMGDENSTQ